MPNNLRLLNDSYRLEQPITKGSGRPLLKTLGRGAVTEVEHRYSQIVMSVGRATRGGPDSDYQDPKEWAICLQP